MSFVIEVKLDNNESNYPKLIYLQSTKDITLDCDAEQKVVKIKSNDERYSGILMNVIENKIKITKETLDTSIENYFKDYMLTHNLEIKD